MPSALTRPPPAHTQYTHTHLTLAYVHTRTHMHCLRTEVRRAAHPRILGKLPNLTLGNLMFIAPASVPTGKHIYTHTHAGRCVERSHAHFSIPQAHTYGAHTHLPIHTFLHLNVLTSRLTHRDPQVTAYSCVHRPTGIPTADPL